MFKKLMIAAAAVSMTASPVLAAANPAAKLSVAPAAARASAPKGESQLFGSTLVTVLLVAVVVAGIIIIADDNNNSKSP